MPGTTMFTSRGDVTLVWDEADDPQILAMIEAQMAAGMTFFIIEPRLGGMAAPNKVPLTNPKDALKQRIIAMSLAGNERAIIPAIESGAATPAPTPEKPARTRRKAATAEKVAANETVGVKAKGGG